MPQMADLEPWSRPGMVPASYGAAPVIYAGQKRPLKYKESMTSKGVFIVAGVLLLAMLCVVPVWNAVALASDSNFVFWVGRGIPNFMIFSCIMLLVIYVITMVAYFGLAHEDRQNEQTIMLMANLFVTLLGLMLMLISLPLSQYSMGTAENLMHRCEISEQTHRIYEYSQVLHNIRAQPHCSGLRSVEECAGYQAAPPYTDFLKNMEAEFRCSGFCYRPLEASSATSASEASKYPPTLFSDANFQSTCEGMAARDMTNFAADVAMQTFYQGIYFVLIGIAMGFLKLVGLCVRKPRAGEEEVL